MANDAHDRICRCGTLESEAAWEKGNRGCPDCGSVWPENLADATRSASIVLQATFAAIHKLAARLGAVEARIEGLLAWCDEQEPSVPVPPEVQTILDEARKAAGKPTSTPLGGVIDHGHPEPGDDFPVLPDDDNFHGSLTDEDRAVKAACAQPSLTEALAWMLVWHGIDRRTADKPALRPPLHAHVKPTSLEKHVLGRVLAEGPWRIEGSVPVAEGGPLCARPSSNSRWKWINMTDAGAGCWRWACDCPPGQHSTRHSAEKLRCARCGASPGKDK